MTNTTYTVGNERTYTINQTPKMELIDMLMLNERDMLLRRLAFLEDSLLTRGQIKRRRLKPAHGR